MASDIRHYFTAWTQYLIDHFDSKGHAMTGERPPFDVEYIAKFDSDIVDLPAKPEVQDWLTRLDHATASGDDFE